MDYIEEIKKMESALNNCGIKNICFMLPSRMIGGGPILLYHIAKCLLDHTDLNVFYIDFNDGYSHVLFKEEPRVRLLPYDDKADEFPIDDPILLVTQPTRIIQARNMHPDSRILLWHWETVPCGWDSLFIAKEAKKFLRLVKRTNSMAFHEWGAWDVVCRQMNLRFKKNYIPIYAENKNRELPLSLLKDDAISVAWVGRFSTDKVSSIYNLIDNFVQYKTEKKKRLVLIGSGLKQKEVRQYCRKFQNEVEIWFVGNLPHDELSDFLLANADVVFGMATSVLEGACLRIPSVITTLNATKKFDSNYIWLFDTKEYCLGPMQEQKLRFPGKYTNFSDIIDSVAESKEDLGNKCYEYYAENFSDINKVTYCLLNAANNSKLSFALAKKCIKYVPYNRISCVQYRCHRIPIWTKITYPYKERTYKLFNLTLFTVRWEDNRKIYMPFGLRSVMQRFTMKCYAFPNSATKQNSGYGENRTAQEMMYAMKYKQEEHRQKLLEKRKRGEKITVALFAPRITDWQFGRIYQLLEESKEFEPTVVVSPFMLQGNEKELMATTYEELKSRGYRIIQTYDEKTGEYIDLRETLNPDVLFHTYYWKPHFLEKYYITHSLDKINFLTPYCFETALHEGLNNFEMRNVVDRLFLPTSIHEEMGINEMDNQGENICITGTPKLDDFYDPNYVPTDVWKPQEKRKKRIIWAPHHSDNFPSHLYQYNAFYELAWFMLDMAEKYKDEVQFAFRPHPVLRLKIEEKWGKESSDAYYERWANLDNGQYADGEFIDLFMTSDAMILDSISFMSEYTACNKPAFFTIGSTTRVQLNAWGEKAFEVLYKPNAGLKDGIESFIEDVVIAGNDTNKEARDALVKEYLVPPNGKSAAQNIVDCMYEEIFGEEDEQPQC